MVNGIIKFSSIITKTSGNCFCIVNSYFLCHFVIAFGLAVISYCPSSFVGLDLFDYIPVRLIGILFISVLSLCCRSCQLVKLYNSKTNLYFASVFNMYITCLLLTVVKLLAWRTPDWKAASLSPAIWTMSWYTIDDIRRLNTSLDVIVLLTPSFPSYWCPATCQKFKNWMMSNHQ